MSLANVWHLRAVAEISAKPCIICYKASTSVLITPDNKDFFYVCKSHLKDKGFCSPIIDEAEAAAKKKKEEMDREIELVKKEYEEKMRKKKEKKKEKDEGKDKDKDQKKDDNKQKEEEAEDNQKAEKEKNDKIKAITDKDTGPKSEDIPRIYALQKNFFQIRLDRMRNAEIAKRNRERLKNPSLFPTPPSGNP